MAIFDDAAAAILSGSTVVGTLLVFFDFASAPKRLHSGFGDLLADGRVWQGLGGLGSVSAIESSISGTAPTVTFTLSGVGDGIARDVVAAPTEIKGRACAVRLAFFTVDTLAPIGLPYTLFRGTMDRLIHQAPSATNWTAQLTAETRFVRRGLPPFGQLTDRDQQRRYPGDTGLKDVPLMQSISRPWNPDLPS
jgi:hypothetical protein